MKTLFAVTRTRGPVWDASKPMRSQEDWDAHAAFMDQLAVEGFIVFGGPIGERVDEEFLLVINAVSEDEVSSRLAGDPWTSSGMLTVREIRPWSILLDSTLTD